MEIIVRFVDQWTSWTSSLLKLTRTRGGEFIELAGPVGPAGPLPRLLFFQLLMDLCNYESAQRGIMFFSLLRMLKLLLK